MNWPLILSNHEILSKALPLDFRCQVSNISLFDNGITITTFDGQTLIRDFTNPIQSNQSDLLLIHLWLSGKGICAIDQALFGLVWGDANQYIQFPDLDAVAEYEFGDAL